MSNDVYKLIQALRDGDRDVRWQAAQALGEIGDAGSVESLCQALRDRDGSVRRKVAEALGKIDDAGAVESLCRVLRDEDSYVRWKAAEALGKIGDVGAVGPLCKVFGDEDGYVRRKVAEALGKIGDAGAVESLCRALGDGDRDVRRYAAEALGEIGDVGAVESLCQALGDGNSYVRWKAGDALGKIGDRDVLPRKILLSAAMSLKAREAALNALQSRKAQYALRGCYHRDDNPDALQFCEQMAGDTDARVREAAEEMLRFLAGDTLLRASQRDETTEQAQLLRGASGEQSRESGDELGRGAEAPSLHAPGPSGFWRRFRSLGAGNRTKVDGPEV